MSGSVRKIEGVLNSRTKRQLVTTVGFFKNDIEVITILYYVFSNARYIYRRSSYDV